MIRSVRLAIARPANSEKVETAVTGVEGITKRITEIWPEQVGDTILRGYVGTDRIVDVHMEADVVLNKAIPVDRVLEPGEEFKVGFLDETGGAATQDVVVFYSEE